VIEFEKVRELTVSSKRKRVRVTMDGEVTRLTTPLNFRVLPRGLHVLAPPLPESAVAPTPVPVAVEA
jgi:diacylglycerol kinase family enzyme